MGVKSLVKKLISGKWFPLYHSFFAKKHIRSDIVLLESRGGLSLEGNILRILIELQKSSYKKFKKILVYKKGKKKKIKARLSHYGISDVIMIKYASISYYMYLSIAGYLVNDTSFPGRFVKKKGQIYLNTWHGTPLKRMGCDNFDEICTMGNVERNLIQADFLLFPNIYMQEKMCGAYMLDNLSQGIILQEGYPRNSVFFDKKGAESVRKKLHFEGMQIIVYMPTFRGKIGDISVEKQITDIQKYLKQIDSGLRINQRMIVNFHPFLQREISIEQYEHINIAPPEYDIYEILNMADVLVTDYSSVFYDFAITDKKIILFPYDEEVYRASRGIYEKLEEYPFPKVTSISDLLEEINNTEILSRKEFRKRYDTFESPYATEKICRQVFLKDNVCKVQKPKRNGKENILIYAGDLNKNGITTALCSMLEGLDKSRFNYFIAFRKSVLEKEPQRLKKLPRECGIYPLASELETDILTLAAHAMYFRLHLHFPWITKRLDRQYLREWKKHFGSIQFRQVIHYNGYERYVIALFQRYPGIRTIWVHNDMEQEIKNRKIQDYQQLHDAYCSYDHVVVVSEDIKEATIRISGRTDNILVIGNCHQYQLVRRKAELPLEFQKNTICTWEKEKLEKLLASSKVKFINIGRFSVEKGHKRLIQAFE